ncbi:MAG TPA: VCBS repeat-containing protein, partial [bacterium]|nr:VCBS repeat-containing protein [bacterium]
GAETVTADIHRNGDKYCFAVRATDAVYAQDGTILATNRAPVLSTNVVDQGDVQLTTHELIAASAGNHTINIKNMGDINGDGRTDFAVSDSGQQKAYVFTSNATGAPTKLELTKPADAGTSFGYRLAVADLDGNEHKDVVVSDIGGKNLHIYYGTDGSVNVERGDKVTLLDAIYDIAGVDDYNGDGCDDLAVGQAFYDDPGDATTDDRTNRVLVLYGDDKGASGKTCIGDYAAQVGVSHIGKAAGERFGYNVKKVGDIKKGETAYGCFVGGHYDNVNPANAKITNGKVFYGSSSPTEARVTTYDFTVSGLSQIRTMFSGELNGDDHADFAVISGGGEIRFFFGSEAGTVFPGTWTEGVNRVTRSVIMDELVGVETGAWGVGNSGASEDVDGDGLADTFISGVQSQSLYSGRDTFFTAHPSVYLSLPVTSGNVQTTVLSYGLVICDRNADTGNCVLYYH